MLIIPYIIQKSVCKTVNEKKRWYYEYEQVFVEASDEVAAFLEKDDKREQRYQWKIKKQIQDAGIHTVFSLDELVRNSNSEEYIVADLIEDTVHPDNYDPLEIAIEKETEEEGEERRKELAAGLDEMCASLMTKKQYEVWKYRKICKKQSLCDAKRFH